jgi:HAE1 family hydrophobic/amphiphilic exporter-1
MGLVGQLETEMIPEPDEGEFRVEARFAPSTALETTRDFSEQIRRQLGAVPDIRDIYQVIGQSMTYANPEANVSTFFVLLKEKRRPIKQVIRQTHVRLEQIPIPGFSFKIIQSSASEGMVQPDLDVLVYGDDLERIAEEANRLLEQFKTYDGLSNLDLSIKPGKTEIQFIPQRDKLSFYRLPVFSLATSLRAHYAGVKTGVLKIGEENFDIKIMYPDRDLPPGDIDINTFSGLNFSLDRLVDFRLTPTPAAIKRMNQQRFAEIKADVINGRRRDLDKRVASLIDKWRDNKDVRVEKKRVSAGIAESFKSMGIALMLSIFLVYVVMGSQFNSFKQPFIISFTIPLGIIGVVLILWLTGTPLNLNSFLGGVVMVGIVVNNGILLVDFINRKRETQELQEAIVAGSILRMRPILMTALTTILGMLPLAVGWGKGSESLSPLARAVIGGLTFSTLTALFVIPALYLLITPKKS